MLYCHYHSDTENTILLSPPIQFGRQSHYDITTSPHFAVSCRFRLSFTQNFFFVQKGPTGGTVCRLLSLCSQIVIMALRGEHCSIFWKMTDVIFSVVCNNNAL